MIRRFPLGADYLFTLRSKRVGCGTLQRVYELVHERDDWTAERYFLDGQGVPVSLEHGRALGDQRTIAFSISFEEDYVHFVQMLDRARIPARRHLFDESPALTN